MENPTRERVAKVALREIVEGHLKRTPEGWMVDRPPMPEIFTPPPATTSDDEDILGLRSRGGDDEEE